MRNGAGSRGRALAAAVVAAGVAACTDAQNEGVSRGVGRVFALLVVLALAWIGAAAVLLVGNALQRLQGRPRRGWGIAAMVVGSGSTAWAVAEGALTAQGDLMLLPLVGCVLLFAVGLSNTISHARMAKAGLLPPSSR